MERIKRCGYCPFKTERLDDFLSHFKTHHEYDLIKILFPTTNSEGRHPYEIYKSLADEPFTFRADLILRRANESCEIRSPDVKSHGLCLRLREKYIKMKCHALKMMTSMMQYHLRLTFLESRMTSANCASIFSDRQWHWSLWHEAAAKGVWTYSSGVSVSVQGRSCT